MKFRSRAKSVWLRFKSWFVGILIALGLVVGSAYALPKDFTWTNPTQRVDGSDYPLSEQAETRIYCDGDASPLIVITDGSEAATSDFIIGNHSCYATSVDTDGQESDPSNTVTFDIIPALPSAPVLSVN